MTRELTFARFFGNHMTHAFYTCIFGGWLNKGQTEGGRNSGKLFSFIWVMSS